MNERLITMMDCLLYFLMYQLDPYRPNIAPTEDQAAIQSPYSISNLPAKRQTVQAATFEYIIRYIPVAEETFGGTPMPIKYGLKMTPPPRPSAPATKPPPKPN